MDFPQGMDFGEEALPRTGMIISGALHLGVIALVLFSPFLKSRDSARTVATTEVSLISPEEFAALTVPEASRPEVPRAAIALPVPAPEGEAAPAVPAEAPSEPVAPPAAAPLSPPEPVAENIPEIESPPASPVVEVEDTPPEQPAPEALALAEPPSETPTPREAPRVAPEPAAPAPPEALPDEVLREEVSQSPEAAEKQPETEPTAPPEASTEIVTEAEKPASSAPVSSPRPRARPARPAPPVAVAEAPAPEEAAEDAMAAAIAAAVEDAASTPAPAASSPAAAAGPPLSRSEKEGFRLAVSRCWNVGALSAEALRVTVTVGFSLTRDGRPEPASLRMISASGGSDGAARQAYEAARRAILRCGARGYNLPIEKYEHWRDIEITFNPEKMRIK